MRYSRDRFFLNDVCEFRDPEVEAAFMEYEKTASATLSRLLLLLMGFVFALFTISDYYFHGMERAFYVSVALRISGLLISVIVCALVGKLDRHEHTLLVITFAELLVFSIYLMNLYTQQSREPALQFMSVMIFILATFLIPNRWKNSLFASLTILLSYIVFCALLLENTEQPTLTQRGIYLSVCLISCAIFIYGRESSERRHFAAEQLLEFLSITDRLTGIYNRGRFEHLLAAWIKNGRHDPFCLLLFDIDNFKKVNDHYGHSAGDEVLIKTTEVITANIRDDDDIFARWGGEEFVLLFGGTGLAQAGELAERLRKAVEDNYCGKAGKVTVSVGVTQYRREESILDFINRADEKMYEAKKAGKNRVVLSD